MRRETLSAVLHPDFSIRILLGVLLEEGHDPAPALRAAGVPSGLAEDLPMRVSGRQELGFQQVFVRTTGYRPDLWLRAGQRYRFAALGRLGLLFMTARDLRQIVETRLRTYFSYTASYTHPIVVDGRLVGQVLDVSDVPEEMLAFAACHALGTICTLYRDLYGRPFPFVEFHLAIPDPGPAFRALLPAPARFDAERTAWYWRPEVSTEPLPYRDAELNRVLLEEMQRELCDRVESDDLLARVRSAIITGGSSIGEVAAQIGIAPRTLQRRLSDRGLGFRELVESIRREEAIGMLLATDMPVADIAFRVGYADQTGFEHAFRRWTGASPRQFRGRATTLAVGED